MEVIKTPSFELGAITFGDPNAKKLALCLPGYCDTKDYPDIRTHAELLAQRGYYAVAFDPPGTWDSPGGTALYTTSNYLRAIDELIALFGNRPTLLIGKSMGGRMALLGAQNQAVIAVVDCVGQAGAPLPSTYTKAAFSHTERHRPHRDLPDNSAQFRDFEIPFSFVEDSFRYDALLVVGELTMPKLFVAGNDDVLAPPAVMRKAYAAAAEPKELVLLDMDHDYRKDPAKLQLVNDCIAQFLDHYQL